MPGDQPTPSATLTAYFLLSAHPPEHDCVVQLHVVVVRAHPDRAMLVLIHQRCPQSPRLRLPASHRLLPSALIGRKHQVPLQKSSRSGEGFFGQHAGHGLLAKGSGVAEPAPVRIFSQLVRWRPLSLSVVSMQPVTGRNLPCPRLLTLVPRGFPDRKFWVSAYSAFRILIPLSVLTVRL